MDARNRKGIIMASMKQRGKKFNVWFDYRDENGCKIRQFETYADESHATRRKEVIDQIQAKREGAYDTETDKILRFQVDLYLKYRKMELLTDNEKVMLGLEEKEDKPVRRKTNYDGLFSDFVDEFLPNYARLNLTPASLENRENSLNNHILPLPKLRHCPDQ